MKLLQLQLSFRKPGLKPRANQTLIAGVGSLLELRSSPGNARIVALMAIAHSVSMSKRAA
jgi:hypothetical protein